MNRRELLAGAAGLAAASVMPVAPVPRKIVPLLRDHHGMRFLLAGKRLNPVTGRMSVLWKMAVKGENFSVMEWQQALEWYRIINGGEHA